MGANGTTPIRPVKISVDVTLARQAQRYTDDLNATVETLLGDFISRETQRQHNKDAATERLIDSLNEFHRTHGLLSDEFPTL